MRSLEDIQAEKLSTEWAIFHLMNHLEELEVEEEHRISELIESVGGGEAQRKKQVHKWERETCSKEGCKEVAISRGLCQVHYGRERKLVSQIIKPK